MCSLNNLDSTSPSKKRNTRSHSAQGLAGVISSPALKLPMPPRLWITDVSDESSDEDNKKDDGVTLERPRVRSRFRHHKQRAVVGVPIGIFWDIENCQVPRGCSAIDVVAAIRAKFLTGKREADFVVVCDVRKESPLRLQELNDAQVSLIHVCGTQKNAADEKLRQCMRRFGELHLAPAALVLISGDINFAADLSDFRHRKNMEVILVHKKNTSSALIACASSHYCYNELTASLPRNSKISQSEEDEETSCEVEIANLPTYQPPERVSRRLRRLADNCGGKVLRVTASTAVLRFPTPDHACRALKRMDGEDVFGCKIATRYARAVYPAGGATAAHAYSSDEGYGTATPANSALPGHPAHHGHSAFSAPANQCGTWAPPAPNAEMPCPFSTQSNPPVSVSAANDWALALAQLPAPTPPPHNFCPPPAPRPRQIRGTHGSANLDRSGSSSYNSGDDARHNQSRAASPWNSSASFSEQSDSEPESLTELTITNLPPFEINVLQDMINTLVTQYVTVVQINVWMGSEGPVATIMLRSEWDARLLIAKIHKRRLDNPWNGRRLELSLGKPSPAPNLETLKTRLRAILLEQRNHALPLLQLRDVYASRYCCTLTTSDILKVRDTVVIHENYGRVVQLINLMPMSSMEHEEAPWKCLMHATVVNSHDDGSRILQPVFIEIDTLAQHTKLLLENHGGILPLLSFVDCYESIFAPLSVDPARGVSLELLLRSVPGITVRDMPSRHLTWATSDGATTHDDSGNWSATGERSRPRTSPVLEPMLALFERELIDLLRTVPRCCIPFSKLIPSFHHHFGRQCRVADYGFTKLPDLLAALSNTIVVLGSGSSRVITISATAQGRRWTGDLVKLLNNQPGRTLNLRDIPQIYQATFDYNFSPVQYGVCTLHELMRRVNKNSVIVSSDGILSLPRPQPTPMECARASKFALEAIQVLCQTPNLRMEFSRFVPSYHAHFGRQLRVAHFGCVKLIELFEMISEVVTMCTEPNGERCIRLSKRVAKAVIAKRLHLLGSVSLNLFPKAYAVQFGALPLPDILSATSVVGLIYAAGGCIEDGEIRAPRESSRWVTAMLTACAVLSVDRSVASRGSTEEYFTSAYRRSFGAPPNIETLKMAEVIEAGEGRVRLATSWRIIWRVAQLLADRSPLTAAEILTGYTSRYEPTLSLAELGFDSIEKFLHHYSEVFVESGERWALLVGVSVPLCEVRTLPVDYSIYDTPPGQKGSRVFESPKTNIWCSPPASAVPAPTELLTDRRRTRLAAHFDAA